MGIGCKRPKLELEHGPDYDDGKEESKELLKQIASVLKKESDVSI